MVSVLDSVGECCVLRFFCVLDLVGECCVLLFFVFLIWWGNVVLYAFVLCFSHGDALLSFNEPVVAMTSRQILKHASTFPSLRFRLHDACTYVSSCPLRDREPRLILKACGDGLRPCCMFSQYLNASSSFGSERAERGRSMYASERGIRSWYEVLLIWALNDARLCYITKLWSYYTPWTVFGSAGAFFFAHGRQ